MAIENLFITAFTIKSLEYIADTSKEQFGSESTTYYCHFQEFSGELESFFDGGTKKSYQIWFSADVDLQQGMVVIIDEIEYDVASVISYNMMRGRNMSGNKHKKAMIFKTN